MDTITDNRVHLAKLSKKTEVAKNTFEFCFKTEDHLDFESGQYVWLRLYNLSYPDKRGDRRAFSITNIPNDKGEICILLRKSESGFNKTLLELEEGQELKVIGPFGTSFCLPENPKTPLVLLGGGVGIAPFLSITRHYVAKKIKAPINLLYFDESAEMSVYVDEINNFCSQQSNCSGSVFYEKFSFDLLKSIKNLDKALFYISGSQGFVDSVNEILSKNGIFKHQLRFENFYPTDPSSAYLKKVFSSGENKEDSDLEFYQNDHDILLLTIESSSQHIVVTDINGNIVFANKAAQETTGYTFDEMEGQTPRLWGGMMPQDFYEKTWEIKMSGGTVNEEIVNRRKDDALYTVMAHIAPIKNETGTVVGFIGTEEDITYIRSSESKAKNNEQRFIELANNISEVFLTIEMEPIEKVTYVSPAFNKLWGLEEKTLYDNPRAWLDCIHKDDAARVLEAFNNFVINKTSYEEEYRIVRKDNEILWIFDKKELILNEAGEVVRMVGVARDITKEKIVDQEKTEFVSLASHQLKTPIGSISWNAEMLLSGDYGAVDPKQKEVISEIYQSNRRMKELIDGLLNVSRIDLGVFIIDPTPIDFTKVCEDVLNEMKPRIIAKGHEIIKNYGKDLPLVPADPNLLRIIFQNFISNAIKYTPDHGRVTIGIKIEYNDIIISVANNGEPIPKDEQNKIFSKLFRASNAQKQDTDGTGLGLYLVKAIVENGGGKVWFESEEGKDTIFYISFPISGMIKKEGEKKLT
ncbi:MAG: PAS domain-containing protein [Candidatus Falkowbacteria bacterium]|nr:PAS domain-containing protein [Candidatus Falkowbacteria bacterium]